MHRGLCRHRALLSTLFFFFILRRIVKIELELTTLLTYWYTIYDTIVLRGDVCVVGQRPSDDKAYQVSYTVQFNLSNRRNNLVV